LEQIQERSNREYKPAEVAKMLEISTDLLRKWAVEFNIPYETTDKGHRRYSKENVEVLIAISKKIKEQNWSWDQVKAWRNGEHDTFSTYEEKSNLEKKLDEVLEYAKKQEERADRQEQFNLALLQKLQDMESKYQQLHQYVQIQLPNREEFQERNRLLIEMQENKEKVEKEKAEQKQELIRVNETLIEMQKQLAKPAGIEDKLLRKQEEETRMMREELAEMKRLLSESPTKDEWITRRRIEQKLRKEAIELWNSKPEEERIIKRWFRKEEDKIKRDDFIQSYVDEKIIEQHEKE
jgi:DNA-binding transcriptional MerR regulator